MQSTKKKHVFITGASGFVGANLTRYLLGKNYTVHVILRTASIPWRLQEIASLITIHHADITHLASLKKAVENADPDYIVHLAAYGAYHYQDELKKMIQVNVMGLQNLLKATRNIPYLCFINTSSSSEYGMKKHAMKETDACDPVSYYAATKLAATNIGKVFAKTHNKPLVTVRLFSVYGPYEEPGRLVPTIMRTLLNKETINLPSGIQRRDFIAVEDVCRAYEKALLRGNELSGEILNIGTGSEYTSEEVVQTLFSVTHDKTTIKKGTYAKRQWDTAHWKADTTHTETTLQWKPAISLDKGLKSTYSWFAKHTHYYTE
jgi:nucleoside-diphosphate-sugar epimerase